MNISFTAEQIAAVVNGEIIGDKNVMVGNVSQIESGREGTLCFLGEARYLQYLQDTKASVVLLTRSLYQQQDTNATLILVDNARQAMAQLLAMVAEVLNPRKKGHEQPCFIAEDAVVPEDTYIGAFTYIGKGAKIGKNVQIYPQTYIGDYTVIGDNTTIYAGVKIYHHISIGKDCIIHSGVVIGADGFGFETDKNGVNQKVPQIGTVIVEDDVEIGANTTIDRAMMGATIIKRNAKIDNLVQIAHSVTVGESTFLCAQVGIAGSTEIGNHCILTGQTGVAGHIKVTDNCIFGAQTGIAGNISKPGMYQGTPAIPAHTWRRSTVVFKALDELQKQVRNIEKQIQGDVKH